MKRPNIMLVVLDATRADVCSCYGGPEGTTPVLDRLASEGTLYEQAISAAPWTLPAVASMLTGLFPGQTGIYNSRVLPDSIPTLPELLKDRGYATFGITNNSWMSASFGLQRGFDTMHKQWQLWQTARDINKLVIMESSQGRGWFQSVLDNLRQGNVLQNGVNAAYTRLFAYRRDLGAARLLRPMRRWIEKQERPWFAFVHFLEAHLPYKPPPAWQARFVRDAETAQRLKRADQWRLAWRHMTGVEAMSPAELRAWRELYLACVAYADSHLGGIVDWLRASSRLDDTVLIVVADHGESLGEDDLLNHQYSLNDRLIRVPFVVRFPERFEAGRREEGQIQTLDLFATVLELTGALAPKTASRSLLGAEHRPFTVAEYGRPRTPHERALARYGLQREQVLPFARGLTALRTERHKLIVDTEGGYQLYERGSDPAESVNLADEQPETVRALEELLAQWREEHAVEAEGIGAGEEEIDPEVQARLEALGYLE